MYQVTLNPKAVFMLGMLIFVSVYASWIDRLERKIYGVKPGVYIEEQKVGGFLPEELEVVLDELVIRYREMPRNPYLDRETGEIIPEKYGVEVDVPATYRAVFNAPAHARVRVITKQVPPLHTARELEEVNRQIGYFHTWFYGSGQRYENITLALLSINNQIVWPGETFSFNEVVGPRTPERGYRMAPVIGGDGLGFGGGVCQVSTTLYNAVLDAGLEVVERHPHSSRVPYVAPGKDATVVFDALDFRFRNNTDYPVIIKAGMSRGKISVQIIGK
ncbi:MAG: VanW family protein [Syntrophomonadaceae bacterium]|nr:VanW family protein [Syntrophomonadaceae bacterium]